MRYRWQLNYFPTTCVCGKAFSTDHAMLCCKGSFMFWFGKWQRRSIMMWKSNHPSFPSLASDFYGTANVQDEARPEVSVRGFCKVDKGNFLIYRFLTLSPLTTETRSCQQRFQPTNMRKICVLGESCEHRTWLFYTTDIHPIWRVQSRNGDFPVNAINLSRWETFDSEQYRNNLD